MLREPPKSTRTEWKNWRNQSLLCLIKSPNFNFGANFLNTFPDMEEYLISNSNLGTPAGVHHPDDAYILECLIKSYEQAVTFILDRIEITEDEDS